MTGEASEPECLYDPLPIDDSTPDQLRRVLWARGIHAARIERIRSDVRFGASRYDEQRRRPWEETAEP